MEAYEQHITVPKRGERGRLLPLEITEEQVVSQLTAFLRDLPKDSSWGVKTIRKAPGGLYDRLNRFFPKEVGKRGSINWQEVCSRLEQEYVDRFAAKGIVINNTSRWSENIKKANQPKRQQEVIAELNRILSAKEPWSAGTLRSKHPNLYNKIIKAFPNTENRWSEVLTKLPIKLQKSFYTVQLTQEQKFDLLIETLNNLLSKTDKPVNAESLIKNNHKLRFAIASHALRTAQGRIDWEEIIKRLDPAVKNNLIAPIERLQLDSMLFKGKGLDEISIINPSMIAKLPKRRIWELSKIFPSEQFLLDWRGFYRKMHPDAQKKWKITPNDITYIAPTKWFKDLNCQRIKKHLQEQGVLEYRTILFTRSVFELGTAERQLLGILFDEVAIGNKTAFDIILSYINSHKRDSIRDRLRTSHLISMDMFLSLPADVKLKRLMFFILSHPQALPTLEDIFLTDQSNNK